MHVCHEYQLARCVGSLICPPTLAFYYYISPRGVQPRRYSGLQAWVPSHSTALCSSVVREYEDAKLKGLKFLQSRAAIGLHVTVVVYYLAFTMYHSSYTCYCILRDSGLLENSILYVGSKNTWPCIWTLTICWEKHWDNIDNTTMLSKTIVISNSRVLYIPTYGQCPYTLSHIFVFFKSVIATLS